MKQQRLTLQQALDLAVQVHTAGDLSMAENIYQQMLQADPNHPDALQLLGVISHQTGKNDHAVDLIKKALTVRPNFAEAHNNLGNALKGLVRLEEAVVSYHKALAIKPDYAEAHSNLGTALLEQGKLEEAITSYSKALAINPNYAEAHSNLGAAFQELGRLEEAVASYSKALAIKPNYAEAHSNLGAAFQKLGRLEEAVDNCHKAIQINPDYAEALNILGVALLELGKLDEAVTNFRKALSIKPDYGEAHNNLANTLHELGQSEEAVNCYYKALNIKPGWAEVHNNLGITLLDQGKLNEAVASYHKALAIEPHYAEAHNNLGTAFLDLGMLEEAVESYQKALSIKPNFAKACSNLGTALKELGRLGEAVICYRDALNIEPKFAEVYNNLGNTLHALGKLEEAVTCYREALAVRPEFVEAGRNLLFVLLYFPGFSPGELFNEHLRFSENHAGGISPPAEDLTNEPTADRRLRIAYLSSDFWDHPVGRNIMPLLSSHDQAKFEVYCYADVRRPDAITERFQACVDHWHTIIGKSDTDVVRMIRADEIDVLVCLAGRFDKNRPLVCAHRAAPVQVSYHDGATSGLEQMDYWLSDNFLHPPDTKEMFTEELYRLPLFYQYPPIENAPPVAPLPVKQAGSITFGSFNNPAKINKEVIGLWAEVLKSVPDSRLLLKYMNLYDQVSLRDTICERFLTHGVGQHRINFAIIHDTIMGHLERYCEVDIALDPFPFNGATTTFQALWMGVPVVSLAGETFIGRAAGSILHFSGLGELVVDTPEAYVACAQDLAGDVARLGTLRATLRERTANSPLCDALTYVRNVEAAYRDMWRTWCA